MGGIVAEELFFGETSTGVAGDLQAATSAAAQMIGTFGMAGSLLSYEAVATPSGNLVAKVTSTDEGRAAIEQILKDSHEEVRKLLGANRHLVEVLRDALLDRDELVGEEIVDVLTAAEGKATPPVESLKPSNGGAPKARGTDLPLAKE